MFFLFRFETREPSGLSMVGEEKHLKVARTRGRVYVEASVKVSPCKSRSWISCPHNGPYLLTLEYMA